MLIVAICDDEAYFLEGMKKSVSQYLSARNLDAQIVAFSNGKELTQSQLTFDVILLDINLPDSNGIELVQELRSARKHSQVIFITAYEEYAYQAFHVEAVHYLLKPVSLERLSHALDKAMERVAQSDCQTLTILKGAQTQILLIRDILYCESMNHKVFIHTATERYDYSDTLEQLQMALDKRFFRCHRSYLVNLRYVVSKERESATVLGGRKVLLSRRKQQEFTQQLLAFLRQER